MSHFRLPVLVLAAYLVAHLEAACTDPSDFQCADGKCITKSWRCDRYFDCDDDSDEVGCGHTCKPSEFICNDGSCIDLSWKCDGDRDCRSGSDEDPAECAKHTCPPNEWKCPRGVCILNNWICDGEDDCGDGADETSCPTPTRATCTAEQFQCDNGNCISSAWLCDTDNDCGDWSDEANKTNCKRYCPADDFTCNSGQCIPSSWKCDNEADCADHSDEAQCPTAAPVTCPSLEFSCKDGRDCIHRNWVCDQELDCFDGSDEDDCPTPESCSDSEFQCRSGSCIAKSRVCDGTGDCFNDDDELNCPTSTPTVAGTTAPPCKDHDFLCSKSESGGKKCISQDLVCNRVNNCPNGEDERLCGIDECASRSSNNCSQENERCIDERQGYRCVCNDGYQNQQGQCKDIDECQLGVCQQACVNVRGSYKCSCFPGFQPFSANDVTDSSLCEAIKPDPYIIFVRGQSIERIDLTGSNGAKKIAEGLHSPAALDFDYANQIMYWVDNGKRAIYQFKLLSTDQLGEDANENKKVLVYNGATTMQMVDGVAYDWIHQQLFWTDAGTNTVEKYDMSGNKRTVLISTNLDEPRAIVLDPVNNSMYFSDWGGNGKIEKAQLDGKRRRVIHLGSKGSPEYPDGLALDLNRGYLYWIDSRVDVIRRSGLDGERTVTIWISSEEMKPFGFDFFLGRFYFTERLENKAALASVRIGGSVRETLLSKGHFEPLGLKVVHQSKQIRGVKNPCLKDNGGCEDVCKVEGARAVCGCRNASLELGVDSRSCVYVPQGGGSEESGRELKGDGSSLGIGAIIGIGMGGVLLIVIIILIVIRVKKTRSKETFDFDNPTYVSSDDHVEISKEAEKPNNFSKSV